MGALLLAAGLWAPAAGAQGALLARADSAYAAGDAALARRLYVEVLATDAEQSRAIFQLARLETSAARAVALYRRYTVLEPDDAWGHMALGDALARRGRLRDALRSYDRAEKLAPGERDVAIGRARVHSRSGDPEGAMTALRAWLASHPDDAEAWELLGREELRAGRARAADTSFERARSLGREVPVSLPLRTQRDAAPAIFGKRRYVVESSHFPAQRQLRGGDRRAVHAPEVQPERAVLHQELRARTLVEREHRRVGRGPVAGVDLRERRELAG